MDASSQSVFRRSAVASGLVSPEQLAAAEAAIRKAAGTTREARVGEVGVEALANYLVEANLVNRWQAEQLRLGRVKFTLGPYLMVDSIGQGGMGQVFKAEHTIMGRIVAVKVLPRHKMTPEAIHSFRREIRAQAQLDHPNLVRALDANEDGNVHFLVTEYVDGTDLRRLVRGQGRLSLQAAASIIAQAAQGLEHAHEKGMIHRDIKPGNILVTNDGRVKVSDLGLVGYFNEPEDSLPTAGKIVGTADYLSPEQISTPDKVTPASDIYSLGCTLYYAVTGKVPFPGGTTREKARAHCQLQPLDPRRLNPDLSAEFVEAMADMMAKDPRHRLSTARDVVHRLALWANAPAPVLSGAATIPPGNPLTWTGGPQVVPLVVPDDNDESPSQVSQVTHPVASGDDETMPIFEDRGLTPRRGVTQRLLRPFGAGLPLITQWLILAGAVVGLAAVVNVALRMAP